MASTLVVLLLAGGPVGTLGTDVARAQDPGGWSVTDYEVEIVVEEDSDLRVTERIDVRFEGDQRGIFRYWDVVESLPNPLPPESTIELDGDPADYQRVIEIDDLAVDSPSGAPTDLELSTSGDELTARIGDPDQDRTGTQSYVLTYTVRGALNAFTDHDELYWDPVGAWPVPIEDLVVTVMVDGIRDVACYAGSAGTSEVTCPVDQADGRATFAFGRLAAGAFPSVVVAIEPDVVEVAEPLVRPRPGLRQSLLGSAWSAPGAVATLLAGIGLTWWWAWRTARDHVAVGGVTASGQLRPDAEGRRRGLFDTPPVPVRYRPPGDLPPGLLGVLVDERVDPVDVSATIVDLARRGYLTIAEVEGSGWFARDDWELSRVPGTDLGGLTAWEAELLDGLFDGRTEVRVSDLKGTFAGTYEAVSSMLYGEVTRRGWFRRDPTTARSGWLGVGLVVAGLGFASVFALAPRGLALVSAALFVVGLLVAVLSRWAPARTPAGSALLLETLGFREFVARAEADRMAFAEREQVFADYLPYAVAFGVVDRWARAFADLGVDVGAAVGGYYAGTGAFDAARFSAGMNAFASVTSTALAAAPPSSSGGGSGLGGGGFSGGGGGGGGGGAW